VDAGNRYRKPEGRDIAPTQWRRLQSSWPGSFQLPALPIIHIAGRGRTQEHIHAEAEGAPNHSLGTQYANSSFSRAAVDTEAYAVCARRTERWDVHVAEALGGAAECRCDQEAAAVEEDEEMERGDE
jgi:hypothetical protein